MKGLSLAMRPQIVSILEAPLQLEELEDLKKKGLTLLELRMESFANSLAEIVDFAKIARTQDFKLLATARLPSQKFQNNKEHLDGQDPFPFMGPIKNKSKEAKEGRMELFEGIAPYADIIDVERETEGKEKASLLSLLRRNKCQLLLSEHNFGCTPECSQMQAALGEAQELRADFLKLAYYIRDQEDLGRLFSFSYEYHRKRKEGEPRLIWIGMGPWGLFSRVLASFSGSPFSYAFLTRPNAPGQFSVDQLHQEFLRYHPEYQKYIEGLS